MIPPSVYLKQNQNPMELEEALRMRGHGKMGFGVETWDHTTQTITGSSFTQTFTDWNTMFQSVNFVSGGTAAISSAPGSATAPGVRVRFTGEKQVSGKIASQGTAWRLDWLSGALTLTKGITAGPSAGSFVGPDPLANPDGLSDMELIAQMPANVLRTDYPNMQKFAKNIILHGWQGGQASFDDTVIDWGGKDPSYCQPQFVASGSTGTTKVFKASGKYGSAAANVLNDATYPTSGPKTIPYHPIVPATGNDHQCNIIVPAGISGQPAGVYELTETHVPVDPTYALNVSFYELYSNTYYPAGSAGGTDTYVEALSFMPAGQQGNAHTLAPVMPLFPVVATPQEIIAGVIPHALSLSMSGKCAMGAQVKAPATVQPSDPNFGVLYGGSLAPASLVENTPVTPVPDISTCAPEGMRLVFNNTDAQISALLDADPRGLGSSDTGLRRTLRIFMVCLRDYGIIQTQTGGASAIPVSGSAADQVLWKGSTIGFPAGTTVKLPPGTMTVNNVVGLIPPTNTKADGTTTKRELSNAVKSMYVASDLTTTGGGGSSGNSYISSSHTAQLLNGERFQADLYLIGGSSTGRIVITLPDGTVFDETVPIDNPFTTLDLSGATTVGDGIVGNVERFRVASINATNSTGTNLLDLNPQGRDPSITAFNDAVSGGTWALTNATLVSRIS